MTMFLKSLTVVAVVGIVVIAGMFVLDLVGTAEMRDALQKILLLLGIFALGGLAVSFVSRPGK